MSDLNLNQNPNADQPQNQEDLELGLKALSFCIPIAGAIIYFVNKDKAPVKAKSACTMALIGFGVGLVLQIIQRVLMNQEKQLKNVFENFQMHFFIKNFGE